MLSLDQLCVGQRARIQSLSGIDALLQRLMEMGVLEGEEIEILAIAPLGDPVEIRVRDYRLSLRRREAACIGVILLETAASEEQP
jgi:ferrous iron transport protein A